MRRVLDVCINNAFGEADRNATRLDAHLVFAESRDRSRGLQQSIPLDRYWYSHSAARRAETPDHRFGPAQEMYFPES